MITALLAIVLVVMTAQLLGALALRLGQPRVVGEILGGIALGPSLLGALWPGLETQLFTPVITAQLNLIAQMGLALFMFLIGMELSPEPLLRQAPLASRIALAGVLLPLVMGFALAYGLEAWQPQLIPGDHSLAGVLFMGTAMAISAFPVLARILRERGLSQQPLGQLATTVAAVDDLLGWLLLATVVALARSGSGWGALPTLLKIALWALLLLVGLSPLRRWLAERYRHSRELGPLLQVTLYSGALVSGAVTDWFGVHLIIGAFLWGLAMPRYEPLRRQLGLRLEGVVLQLMLPLFFAISGLHTRLDALNRPALWAATALVLAVALGCKFAAGFVMARLGGLPRRESLALGCLMNTRGLTELVVLNVGLSLGVISPQLFSMGVVMTLCTTLLTGPLLGRLGYRAQQQVRA